MPWETLNVRAMGNRVVGLLALGTALASCTSRPVVEPPSADLRQRMDRVVLEVHTDANPTTHTTDQLVVGSEEGAKYAAKNVAAAGAMTGLGIAGVGCHPGWLSGAGVLWLVTCPLGLAAGAVVGVTTAVVGGTGAAIYGAAQARTQEEIDNAMATLDKTLLNLRLANDFRQRLLSATHANTGTKIIDEAAGKATTSREAHNRLSPVIVALKVDSFAVTRAGRLTPDLSVEIGISADLFDAPEGGLRYRRSWSFSETLGNLYTLTDKDGAGLRKEIDTALGVVALTVVDDIFLSSEAKAIPSGRLPRGEVVTVSGGERPSTREWFREERRKADCGDGTAQAALGKAYATIDLRPYGTWGRPTMIDGYRWLRQAEASGHGDSETASLLVALRKNLDPEEIAIAERLVDEWRPAHCAQNRVATR